MHTYLDLIWHYIVWFSSSVQSIQQQHLHHLQVRSAEHWRLQRQLVHLCMASSRCRAASSSALSFSSVSTLGSTSASRSVSAQATLLSHAPAWLTAAKATKDELSTGTAQNMSLKQHQLIAQCIVLGTLSHRHQAWKAQRRHVAPCLTHPNPPSPYSLSSAPNPR